MKRILIILTVILGCSKSDGEVAEQDQTTTLPEPIQVEVTPDFENDSIYKEIKPKILMSYWNAFVKSASVYDVDLSYIEDITFSSQDLGGSTAGIANGSCKDEVLILVDETIFRNLTTGEQIFLMYHELGHDVFNASHDGGGLMAPNIRSLEYNLFQTEIKDFFTGKDYIEWTDEECEIIRDLTNN
jgi:hypothetical protein